jgi:hypothetical protein
VIHDFHLDTGWACGMVRMDGRTGRVVPGGAPVFHRFLGQVLLHLVSDGNYRLTPLADPRERQMKLFD